MTLRSMPFRLMTALVCGAALALAAHSQAEAQAATETYTVRGQVVVAATDRPLRGAAVQLVGTEYGTLADAEGRFVLRADLSPGTYTVRATRIGYQADTREVQLAADPEVDVGTLALGETAIGLEEVVVTGAGAPVERRRLGNVIESVQGEDINLAPAAPSIDAALQGKVTGAVITQNHGQPGGGTSIRLRGTSSILGGAEPLIVIDGVIVDNNSEALVGLAANAPRGGAALTNRLSDIAPSDIERIEVIKGAAAAALYGSRANNGVIQIFTRRGVTGEPRVTFRSEGMMSQTTDHVDLLMHPQAGRGDVFFGPASAVGEPVDRFDIQPEIFQTGYGTTNHLSISGGTDATSYYISGRRNFEEGTIRGQDNGRTSARLRLGQRLAEGLDLDVNVNYIQGETNYIPEGEQQQGVLTSVIFTPTSWDFRFDPDLGRYPYNPILGVNPLDVIENWTARADVTRFLGSTNLTWTPSESLRLSYLFGLDQVDEENTYFQPPFSLSPSFTGSIQNPRRAIRKYNNDLTGTHFLDITPAIDLTTTAGLRYTLDRTNVIRAAASDLPPRQETVRGAVQSASQSIAEMATLGTFVQTQVGFQDRLTVTGALNLEGASTFGPEERWQLFPRVGASWVVTEEPFWATMPAFLSTFRVRGAYGETGGQPPGGYIRFDRYIPTAYGGRAGLIGSSIAGNPELRPERQREFEFGFDLGGFDDRAVLELTYYDQRTSDLVLGVPLPISSGFSTQFQNVGVVRNRGLEATLNTVNVQTPAWTWRSRVSYAANRNRVEELFGDVERIGPFGYLNYVEVGQPIGVFRGATFPRDAQGNIEHTEEGFIAPRGPVDILGDPNPDFTLALGNDFTIGDNLRANVLLDGRFGGEVANFTRRIMDFFGASPITAREIEGEVPEGYYTLNINRHLTYEAFIEDGSFVKLREASIAYQFDQPWVRAVGARSVDLRLAGRNLFTWTDYTGVDPEINLFSANTVARGVEFGTTPIPRQILLGITLSF